MSKPTHTKYRVEPVVSYRVVKSESGPDDCSEGDVVCSVEQWDRAVVIAQMLSTRDLHNGIQSDVEACPAVFGVDVG